MNIADNEYAKGLEKERQRRASEDAAENLRCFYEENEVICRKAYEYFAAYSEAKHAYVCSRGHISRKQFRKLLSPKSILVLTANPVEEAVLLHWLAEENGSPIDSYMVGSACFNVFQRPEHTIVHMHTMHTGEEYARVALNKASKAFNPSCVFLLGVCYGINSTKHTVGSVFVSGEIVTFRINYRDDENSEETRFEVQEEYRDSPRQTFVDLLEYRFNYLQARSILCADNESFNASVSIGRILCCNSLMSSGKVKAAVLKQLGGSKPVPLGGEMEGAGILKSNLVEDKGFDKWAIIKAVCDWGEKKNALHEDAGKSEMMKDALQAYAMSMACGAFRNVIEVL